ncbi:protein NDRG2 [Tachysurus ichikawai]
MTTETQEVTIMEDKPLLTGQNNSVKDAEIAARILLDRGQEYNIETPHGLMHVTLYGTGSTRRPAILTLHDVGMESQSCFSSLFKFEEMQEIVKNFTVVYLDAPGQEEGAAPYPAGYHYVSMDQLAEMIPSVIQFFNFRTVIGIGVGAGAYVLSKFTEETSSNTELVQANRERISAASNLTNIDLFWKSYNNRRDLNIDRNNTLKCPVMLVVGDQAPYEEAVVDCNSKLDPTTTSFLKMADAGGMPHLTQPSKFTEAFKYFIQGMGYMASSCMTRLSRSRTTSLSSSYSLEGSRSRSRTLSQGSVGGNMVSSPSNTMEVSC